MTRQQLKSSFSSAVVTLLATLVLLLASAPDAFGQTKRRGTTKGKPAAAAQTKKTQTKGIDQIKKERSDAEKKISETAGELDRTGRELNRQLNRLNSINADITTSQARVDSLRRRLEGLGSEIKSTADSIRIYEVRLEQMRLAYIDAMRKLQPYGSRTSTLSFIFSSSSFTDAYRRIRYVKQFAAWRQAKADAITAAIDEIASRRARLTSLRHEQDIAFRQAEASQRTLASRQAESERMVTNLKKNEAQLRRNLAQQKKQAAALDAELDRLIRNEQQRIAEQKKKEEQKPAEKGSSKPSPGKPTTTPSAPVASNTPVSPSSLSGSFTSNKGKMPFPVEGSYKIVRPFGRHPHPTLPHVETDNSGIDIETAPGARVRAIFSGTVSAIFKQDGFNSIVMLRHGSYITVYAGLGTVSVTTGQTVTSGQTLGTVFSPAADSPILHFEIRREREKLNPTAWVK